ncbi:FMN-binding negative transcriptional regulator [Roseococcus sp. YIM B11640]|uniref:FMN-binding negative transcriptional regulator n=1 Tax=Roseococcus sp. YIM B11640 TaxID=3133973 RepID=UPI003C7EAF1D
MYIPPAFRVEDLTQIHALIRGARLASLVTATADGLIATPLPMLLAAEEGPNGTLYGHIARANPQGKLAAQGEAMAIFTGPDAYVTPAWYASKPEHGKVVPTWNYVAIHAYGPLEVFDDAERLLDVVTRLTERHEGGRAEPWAVSDAPESFIRAQLRGIVGIRMPITRLDAKRKASQNRDAADRAGVARGLGASADPADRAMAALIPE